MTPEATKAVEEVEAILVSLVGTNTWVRARTMRRIPEIGRAHV